MYSVHGQRLFFLVLIKMSLTRAANVSTNAMLVEKMKSLLNEQYTLTASSNNTINTDRRQTFNGYCKLLNDFDNIPEGHCPYLFDRVTCWQSAPPGTIVELPCVTWPFEKTIPGQTVMRTCFANGSWEFDNSIEAFRTMYKHCTPANCEPDQPVTVEYDLIMKLIVYSRLTAVGGYVASMIALIIAIVIFIRLRKLHCRRNSIHLHCFVSFFFRALLCVIETMMTTTRTDDSTPAPCTSHNSSLTSAEICPLDLDLLENWPCKTLSLLWNYAIVSNYFWILVEGLYLHHIIYFSVFQETRITLYVLFGWGAPVLIMIPWTVVKVIYDNTSCWLNYCNLTFMWILRAPVAFAVTVNLFVFCNIVRELYLKLSTDSQFSDQNRYRKLAKSTLILIMVLGVHYIIFDIILLITNQNFSFFNLSSVLVHCVSVVVNSTWGFVVAYVYCFCNHEVRTELKKRWKEWRSTQQRTSTSHNSTTATCDHLKKPQRIFNSTATLKPSRSFLGLRRNTGSLNNCNECQIRLQLLKNQRALYKPSNGNGFLNPEGTSTQCSTVVNSAQNTLTRTTGRRYIAAANAETVAVQRTNHLSNCWEENESLEGSGSHAISPAFLSISLQDESNSDDYVTCTDAQMPIAFRQLYTDCNKHRETIFETET